MLSLCHYYVIHEDMQAEVRISGALPESFGVRNGYIQDVFWHPHCIVCSVYLKD